MKQYKTITAVTIILIILSLTITSFTQNNTKFKIQKLPETKFNRQLKTQLDLLFDLFGDNFILQHGSGNIRSKADYFQTPKSGMPAKTEIGNSFFMRSSHINSN